MATYKCKRCGRRFKILEKELCYYCFVEEYKQPPSTGCYRIEKLKWNAKNVKKKWKSVDINGITEDMNVMTATLDLFHFLKDISGIIFKDFQNGRILRN